jgi:hypothetical protein
MDNNKNKKTILDLLDNAELELLRKDTDYAKQYLQEEGIDVAEEQAFATNYMKKIQFMAKALATQQQDKTLLEKALLQVKNVIADNANQTNETLRKLLKVKAPSLQYRKLENWTDDEIRDVLADIDLISFLEELDNNED